MTSEELKINRDLMALSQKNMALLLGMKQQHYSRLETGYEGRKPTKHHAVQIETLKFIYEKGLLPKLIEIIKKI